jgi:hypothetical protein
MGNILEIGAKQMKKIIFVLAMLMSVMTKSQVSNPSIILVSTAPSGPCTPGLPNEQVISSGIMFSCQGGTWGEIGGGGGGSGTVTNFAAPSSSWPTWLVPTVTNSTTTPGLTVAAGIIPVANGGTGTASPGLVAGTNITSITGTWPNQTINAATQGTTTAALTFNNSNAGAASGTSFSGATPQTISTNTINAAALGAPNTFNSIQFLANPATASISDLTVNMPNLATGNIVTEEIGVASTAGNSMFIGWNKTATNTGYGEWSTFSSGMPLVLLDTFTSTNSPMSIDNAGNSSTVAGFTCAAGDAACFGATANGTRPAAIELNGSFVSNATQTTVSCSTSGSAIFSQPEQGASDKKVLIHMAACLGTASYTYPVAFTNTPSIYASNNVAASIATAVSTTAVTVTGATTTGSLVLEDF